MASGHGILLLPERGLQPLPDAAFGPGLLLHGQHGLLLFPPYLADQGVEYVIDVVTVRSGRLKEGAAELSGQSQPFLLGDLYGCKQDGSRHRGKQFPLPKTAKGPPK